MKKPLHLLLFLFLFTTQLFAQPANDDCSNATNITVLDGTCQSGFTTTGATFDNYTVTCQDETENVWFSFTAQGPVADITVNGAGGSRPEISLMDGTAGNPCDINTAVPIGCEDATGNYASITHSNTALTVGNVYFVQVTMQNQGAFDICIDNPLPLPNDEPCNATPLTVSPTCIFSSSTNVGASPTATVGTPSCGSYSGGDVWFSFTVPASGHINIATQAGTLTDATMALYSGNCGTLGEIACNDDAGSLMPFLDMSGLSPGTTLHLRMFGFSGAQGTFDVCVSELVSTPPANDQIQNAELLTGCNVAFNTTNRNATNTGTCGGTPANGGAFFQNDLDCNTGTGDGDGADVSYSVENDIYYTFCPPATGTWTLNVVPTNCVTSTNVPTTTNGYQVSIWEGTATNLHTLISGGVANTNLTGATTHNVNVTSTTACYIIQIDGFAGTVCDFAVTLTGPPNGCAILLGSKLNNFSGHLLPNGNNYLRWDLVTNNTSDFFSIERSFDGINFKTIGTVTNLGERTYHFEDGAVHSSAYYRVKIESPDFVHNYSETIFIERDDAGLLGGLNILNVYPLPARDLVNIEFEIGEGNEAYIKLYNAVGQVVLEQQVAAELNTINAVQFDVSDLKAGIYSLVIEDSNQTISRRQRIVKN